MGAHRDRPRAFGARGRGETSRMDGPTDRQKGAERVSERRLYHRPRLRVYGALRDLTAGGSQLRPEGFGMGNQYKRP